MDKQKELYFQYTEEEKEEICIKYNANDCIICPLRIDHRLKSTVKHLCGREMTVEEVELELAGK